jgi:hypothetical protein
MTTIWDHVSGKQRRVRDLRVVTYETGRVVTFVVLGRTHEWPMFLDLDKFREMNPSVDLKEE